jgi:eukaryotic-like serine/threonine-protein kinase
MAPDARETRIADAASGPWDDLELFGPYRLAGLIARGGMAELHLAIRDQRSFRQVLALKRVLPGVDDLEAFNRMFAQEAALTVRLEHPNIVRVFDFGEVDGQAYLAMEYLPGEDLERILRRYSAVGTRMPLRMAAEIARNMASGLAHAHGLRDDFGQPLNLVHRDVTPSNVMFTYQGLTKLVDFGIAKARGNTAKTNAGAIKGKLAYIPPEAFTRSVVDARGDVYAAGCVLWEMMVGARPFEAPNDAALMAAVVHGTLPDVRAVAPDVDDRLAAICMKALAREPDDRFPSAVSLEEELEAYLDETGGHLSNKQIAQWLTGLFGSELCQAKLDVASGTRLTSSLPLILYGAAQPSGRAGSTRSRVGPRPHRVTPHLDAERSASLASAVVAPPPEADRPWVSPSLVGLLVAGVLGLTGWGVWLLSAPRTALVTPAPPAASIVVESSPPGAAVFVDGSPLGRVTPVTLGRLRPGQALIVGVQLSGYEPNERRLVPGAGQAVERFALSPKAQP